MNGFQLLNLYEVFVGLSNKELDINTACIIAKNIHNLILLRDTINDKRKKIIEKYARRNAEGEILSDTNGMITEFTDIASFNVEMDKLLSSDIEMHDDIIPINKESLSDIKITPQSLLLLMECDLLKEV